MKLWNEKKKFTFSPFPLIILSRSIFKFHGVHHQLRSLQPVTHQQGADDHENIDHMWSQMASFLQNVQCFKTEYGFDLFHDIDVIYRRPPAPLRALTVVAAATLSMAAPVNLSIIVSVQLCQVKLGLLLRTLTFLMKTFCNRKMVWHLLPINGSKSLHNTRKGREWHPNKSIHIFMIWA